jgi:hypothetical protein
MSSNETTLKCKPKRYLWVDNLKMFACLLVVIGHRELVGADQELHLKFTYNYSQSNGGRRLYIEKDGEFLGFDSDKLKEIKQDKP